MKNFKEINTWLFNPFKYIAGSRALIIGIIIIIIISVLGYFTDTHFDGVLDIHYSCADITTPYIVHLCYQLINWGTLTLVFYTTARILSKSNPRFIDIAGTLALSQAPLILAALVGFYPGIHLCFDNIDSATLHDLLSELMNNIAIIIPISIITLLISI